MRIVTWQELTEGGFTARPSSATIGVFDGFHLGHRELVARVASRAPRLEPAAVTFRSNPKKVMNAHAYHGDLFTLEQKLEALEAAGVQTVVLIDFSENFSTLAGSDFVSILVRSLATRSFVVGSDFKCGYRHSTDARAFAGLAASLGAETEIVGHVSVDGETVSSSRIRSAIRAGRTEAAASFLGRPYTLDLRRVTESAFDESGRLRLRSIGAVEPAEGEYHAEARSDERRMDVRAYVDKEGGMAWIGSDGLSEPSGPRRPAFLAIGPKIA